MSEVGQNRKCRSAFAMSGLAQKADVRCANRHVRFGPKGELGEPIVRSASPWDRCWSPREVVGPKVNSDGRQAQRYTNPEDRRMMDRSSVARSGLHSITSSARERRTRAMLIPIFTVLRLMTNPYLVGCRTGNTDKAPQGKVRYWVSLTVAEFGSYIGLFPRAYLNNEPPPDYRHCRGAHHYGLNGLALPMARHLISYRRSAPRQVDRQNPILQPNQREGSLRR